jgi:protein-disulfide isomerase
MAGAVLIAGLIIFVSIRPAQGIVEPDPREYPMANGNTMGDPNAPVVIKEYSDFQCSHCANFALTTEKEIIDTYIATGYVYLEFVPYFFNQSPSESRAAAEAAYCAGDQDKFWQYHDIVFANFSAGNTGGYSDKRLNAFAEAIGLDMGTFEACFDSHKYEDRVTEDQIEGLEAEVRGTPSFLINDEFVEGALPFPDFQVKIEAALAAASIE